jgi:hypothetical protein
LDSVRVVVLFDDFIDPEMASEDADVLLSREEGVAPDVVRVFHEWEYTAYVDAVVDSFARLDSIDAARAVAAALEAARAAAVEDTAAADTVEGVAPGEEERAAPVDTLQLPDTAAPSVDPPPPGTGAPADTVAARVPPTRLEPLQGVRAGPTADGRRVLPGRRIVIELDGALAPDVEYRLDVTGVRNVFGLTGGGGATTLAIESAPADTSAVDTLSVPDTGRAFPSHPTRPGAPRPSDLLRRR